MARPLGVVRKLPGGCTGAARVAALVCALGCGAGAAAQSAPVSSPLDPVYACAGIGDDGARLACFDAAVAGLQAADGRGEVVAVDVAQVREIERDAFGFALPSLPNLFARRERAEGEDGAADRAAPIEEVRLTIARVQVRADRKLRLYMENGQVWVQIDSRDIDRPEAGDTAVIKRGALGSFNLTINDRPPLIKARRES